MGWSARRACRRRCGEREALGLLDPSKTIHLHLASTDGLLYRRPFFGTIVNPDRKSVV